MGVAVHVGPVGLPSEDLDVIVLRTLLVFAVPDAVADQPQLVLAELRRSETEMTNMLVEGIVLKRKKTFAWK